VPIAMAIFDEHMPEKNQLSNRREDVNVGQAELIAVPTGTRTEAGLRQNVNVGILYLEAWLRGSGCVPLYNLMEDAATAEISRTQLWQWIKHGAELDDGRTVDASLLNDILEQEMKTIEEAVGPERFASGKFGEARRIFESLSSADTCEDFLTLPAYEVLIAGSAT
jgi:malate synthase